MQKLCKAEWYLSIIKNEQMADIWKETVLN
jgi:hypothetical protein